MASKLIIQSRDVQESIDLTTGTQRSAIYNLDGAERYGIQLNLSAISSISATATLEVSLDGINFLTYTGSSKAISPANTSYIWEMIDFAHASVQVKIVTASGTATSAVIVIKLQRG
jgi:hypothetical protein